MKIADALSGVGRIFLDTAPVIYHVEKNPQYIALTDVIFTLIDQAAITAVTSPITLAECLVYPYRQSNIKLQQDFTDLLVHGFSTFFIAIDSAMGIQAAELRARYNLALPDALQFACALSAGCDAFLSNDIALKRVSEISILILDELTI
jgi:predicted nucleic acid-binding protein